METERLAREREQREKSGKSKKKKKNRYTTVTSIAATCLPARRALSLASRCQLRANPTIWQQCAGQGNKLSIAGFNFSTLLPRFVYIKQKQVSQTNYFKLVFFYIHSTAELGINFPLHTLRQFAKIHVHSHYFHSCCFCKFYLAYFAAARIVSFVSYLRRGFPIPRTVVVSSHNLCPYKITSAAC